MIIREAVAAREGKEDVGRAGWKKLYFGHAGDIGGMNLERLFADGNILLLKARRVK